MGQNYRGAKLKRIGYTELWTVNGEPQQPMSWNDALELVDMFSIGPAERTVSCRVCGHREILSYDQKTRKQLVRKDMCFTCDHFDEVRTELGKRTFVADGHAYTTGSNSDYPKGFGGRSWVIAWPDGSSATCDSLWHRGAVPEAWKPLLPDTAELRPV